MTDKHTGIRVSATTLRALPLFSKLPDTELEKIATLATSRSIVKGTTIVRAGDPTDALYVLISGSMKVYNCDNEGREVIIAILGPGEFIGEMGLIDGAPRSANVVAREHCDLVMIGKEAFKRCLQDNFEVAWQMMKSLVRRLREADKKIESLALLDVYGRVAKLLLDQSEQVDGRRIITRKLPKQDIAKMVGASREMVSRVMKDLETSGYISVDSGSIVLLEQ
jgi:CRP/FNR family transcriptional regulator, cyclic AMP receptor protein